MNLHVNVLLFLLRQRHQIHIGIYAVMKVVRTATIIQLQLSASWGFNFFDIFVDSLSVVGPASVLKGTSAVTLLTSAFDPFDEIPVLVKKNGDKNKEKLNHPMIFL